MLLFVFLNVWSGCVLIVLRIVSYCVFFIPVSLVAVAFESLSLDGKRVVGLSLYVSSCPQASACDICLLVLSVCTHGRPCFEVQVAFVVIL